MEHNILKGAYNNDHEEVRAALAEASACINAQSEAEGLTALHIAAALGNPSMVELLLRQADVDLSVKDRFGRDALDVAITTGHPVITQLLCTRVAEKLGLSRQSSAPGSNVVPFPS